MPDRSRDWRENWYQRIQAHNRQGYCTHCNQMLTLWGNPADPRYLVLVGPEAYCWQCVETGYANHPVTHSMG